MALEPKIKDFPRVRSALKLYQIASVITGVMLLLLCAEMLLKYIPAMAVELELGGPRGFLAFVPSGTTMAVNLSLGILIAHGWFYVLYLFADFQLWSRMRWPFWKFLVIALGGVVPLLSFFLEVRITREVKTYLARREAELHAKTPSEATH